MNPNSSSEEVSNLINKIQKIWSLARPSEDKISRIDKDILVTSIRELYELISDLEITPHPYRHEKTAKTDTPAGSKQAEENYKKSVQEAPDNTVLPEDKTVTENEKKQQQHQVTPPQPHQSKKVLQHKKSTLDLFEPSKTVSDKYSTTLDNSLAAKINQNRIEDIRTAIGINDKFLMINHLFNGELSAYNDAIEKLNGFTQFHDALQYIEELKENNLNEENESSFNKLLEIVKRKFH